jgi:hypothetical protein
LGKVTSVCIYPDTAALEPTLQRIAARGTVEALPAPITSCSRAPGTDVRGGAAPAIVGRAEIEQRLL